MKNKPEPVHGTTNGYRSHLYRKTHPCAECKRAWRLYKAKGPKGTGKNDQASS